MRVALYWVPALDDPLYAAGVSWLGRDAESGALVRQPAVDGIAAATAAPRRYGLHATLRPPMRLATSYAAFRKVVWTMAASCPRITLPRLCLSYDGGFLSLRESVACPAVHALADRCVLATEAHRAASPAEEVARRRAMGLTAREDRLLEAYGYPYVLDRWSFHVTLSGCVDAATMAVLHHAAARHFALAMGAREVRDVCICTQREGDFLIAERIGFGGAEAGQARV